MTRSFFAFVAAAMFQTLLAGQTGNDLFQKALSKERVDGQLVEAIALYERVVKEFAGDRSIAAKALLQIARCYERLGSVEAQKAYERLLREYADQQAAAIEARARIAALSRPHDASAAALPRARRLWAGSAADPGSGSTNGELVVFTDWSTGNLAAIELGSGKERLLTHKPGGFDNPGFAQNPAISPDGKLVAYSWFSPPQGYELRVIAVAVDSEPRTLYSNEEVPIIFAAGWSGDGKQLLVTITRKDGSKQIALLSADRGALRVVKSFNRQAPGQLTLSPDGRYIAYDFLQTEAGPERDIALIASDGSREIHLVRHPGHDSGPMWTPDGQRVLFFSDRNGTLGLWGVSVSHGSAHGAPTLIQPDVGQALPMGFNPKGGFHYSVPGGTNDLLVAEMDLETGALRSEPIAVVSRYGRPTYRPDWSRDGRYLAYAVSTSHLARRGPLSIVVRDTQTGQEREMNATFRSIGSSPKWKSDGKALLVGGSLADGPAVTVQFDIADGSAKRLAAGKWDQCAYPQWSVTGDTVLCQVGKEAIVWRNVDSGEEVRRLRFEHVGANVPLSPDGKWLAFRWPDLRTLNVVATDGGERRELFRADDKAGLLTPLSWTPDSQFVLCRTEHGQLWRIPISGGSARQLALPVRGLRELRVHPDGKRIAMLVQEPGSEIWVLENFLPAADVPRPRAKR